MNPITELMKADHVGIREFKDNFSKAIKKRKPTILTLKGQPTQVMLPYDAVVKYLELWEEFRDAELKREINEARATFKRHSGVSAEDVFRKHSSRI